MMSQSWWSLARSTLFTILFNNAVFKCHFDQFFIWIEWRVREVVDVVVVVVVVWVVLYYKVLYKNKKFQITLPVSNSFSDDRLVFVWWFGSPGSEQQSSSRFNSFKFCLMNKSPVSWCCALLCFVHFKVFHMKTGETTF